MDLNNQIYHFLQTIPTWRVVTYKMIANKFGIHPRLVARILSQNKNQDFFPCYKVVRSDGKIGWYNLWIEEKIIRLQKDGIRIENDKISKDYFSKH